MSDRNWEETAAPKIPDHTLLRCIGRGSYGTVWLARNSMGIYRAVKVVYRKSFSEQKPFDRELSGIKKFEPISRSHEGFIDVLHVGINESEGYFYYVMELGDDNGLGAVIDPTHYSPKTLAKEIVSKKKMGVQECLELGLALSLALAELHKRGLVHRDIKPSNIIFVNGIPKLADIGLVAAAGAEQSYVGTLGFIPPEGPGSPSGDVFSLGKVLYEASTGKDRQEFPELPTELGSFPDSDRFLELNEVLLRACQNNVTNRYQTAWEMHADLLVIANGKSVRRLKTLERRFAVLKRFASSAVLLLIVLAGLLYAFYSDWKNRNEGKQREEGANVAYGIQAEDTGDLVGALPYFAKSWRLNSQSAENRLQFNSALALCPKLTTLLSENKMLTDLAWSPDGRHLLVMQEQGLAKIYDVQTGKTVGKPFAGQQQLRSGGYSRDGKWIVTAGLNGSVCIWDAATQEKKWQIQNGDCVYSVAFGRSGKTIVTSCFDGSVRVWNVANTNLIFGVGHGSAIRYAALSEDETMVVTCGVDGTAQVWNVATGRPIGLRLKHRGWVTFAAFSADGKQLLTASADWTARVWEVGTGRALSPPLLHKDILASCEFSPDGQLILTASMDGRVCLWDAETFQPYRRLPTLPQGDKATRATFAGDSRRIAVGSADGKVKIWDLAGQNTGTPTHYEIISRSGNSTAWITGTNILIKSSLFDGKRRFATVLPAQQGVFSGDGRKLLVICGTTNSTGSNCLELLDLGSSHWTRSETNVPSYFLKAAIDEEGSRFALYSKQHTRAWDGEKMKPLTPVEYESLPLRTVVMAPNGKRFAVVCGKSVFVRTVTTGEAVGGPLVFEEDVSMVDFDRSGNRLAGACWDSMLTKCYAQVWDLETGAPIGKRLRHNDGVLMANFSPDGKKIATASEDFTAGIWDIATGRKLAVLSHEGQVMSVQFSEDGKRVVTASHDTCARIWDASSGIPLTPPLQHIGALATAQFLGRGDVIVTKEKSGASKVWDFSDNPLGAAEAGAIARVMAGDTTGQSAENWNALESWKTNGNKYPVLFNVTDDEIERWNKGWAEECLVHEHWDGLAFHTRQKSDR